MEEYPRRTTGCQFAEVAPAAITGVVRRFVFGTPNTAIVDLADGHQLAIEVTPNPFQERWLSERALAPMTRIVVHDIPPIGEPRLIKDGVVMVSRISDPELVMMAVMAYRPELMLEVASAFLAAATALAVMPLLHETVERMWSMWYARGLGLAGGPRTAPHPDLDH